MQPKPPGLNMMEACKYITFDSPLGAKRWQGMVCEYFGSIKASINELSINISSQSGCNGEIKNDNLLHRRYMVNAEVKVRLLIRYFSIPKELDDIHLVS
jgi:hypothetical protein